MASKTVIYHNPRCGKSRQTLALLQEHGIEPEVVRYLETPPSAADVLGLLKKLDCAPVDLLRRKEKPFKELGLSKDSSAAQVAEAIASHPILLERPVVVRGRKAVIGRPPENIEQLLD